MMVAIDSVGGPELRLRLASNTCCSVAISICLLLAYHDEKTLVVAELSVY